MVFYPPLSPHPKPASLGMGPRSKNFPFVEETKLLFCLAHIGCVFYVVAPSQPKDSTLRYTLGAHPPVSVSGFLPFQRFLVPPLTRTLRESFLLNFPVSINCVFFPIFFKVYYRGDMSYG